MRPSAAVFADEAVRAAEQRNAALAMALSDLAWRAWVRMQADRALAVEQVRLADEGMDALRRAGLLGKG